MIRRALLVVPAIAFGMAGAAWAQATPPVARVVGYVWTANNTAIAGATVQVRNVTSGMVAATTRSSGTGEFSVAVPPGSYAVELVDPDGRVMALGKPFAAAAGDTIATFVRMANALPILVGRQAVEVSLGASVSSRRGTAGASGGVIVGAAAGAGRVTVAAEAGAARRAGHNDWRLAAGLRVWLVGGDRSGVFATGLIGTLIRGGTADLAVVAGLGAEWRATGRLAWRVQADWLRDAAAGITANGARAAISLVVR